MGRGRIIVRYNHLKSVAVAIPRSIGSGVEDTADGIENDLKLRLWKRTGTVISTVRDRDPSRLHALISVGLNRGRGFYSRFNEWGTVKQAARPVVGPVGHEWEPKYVRVMTRHIKEACNAK